MRGKLWRITVVTSREAEEAVVEAIESQYGLPVSSYVQAETDTAIITTYPKAKPANWPAHRESIRDKLAAIKACGLQTGPAKVALEPLRNEDWAESWKQHFKPIRIGSKLLVQPSWAKIRPRKNQANLVLDPGLTFGTGQHATTRFCLEQLVERRKPGTNQSVLDLGTGSGILALCAARLGYAPVDALDIDPVSIRIAHQNALNNGLAKAVTFRQADITRLPARPVKCYSIVCANLISTLLCSERDRILPLLASGATLVLAGILHSEFSDVKRVYTSEELRLIASQRAGEWHSASFQRRTKIHVRG